MTDESFNKSHPELRDGEVFIGNTSLDHWECVGWKTKRMGDVAYNIYGEPLNGIHPTFAQAEELRRAGVNPDSIPILSISPGKFKTK